MKLTFIIDQEFDRNFIQNDTEELEFNAAYLRDRGALSYTKDAYQASWDQISDAFFSYIEKETKYAWNHTQYECVISSVHAGISNWDGSNCIIRWWKEHPLLMRRITAHELIIHHYFVIIREEFHDKNLTDGQMWALAEIAAFALTSSQFAVSAFWPWDTSGYYSDHNYSQLVPLQEALRQPFLERENFIEYMREGVVLVKYYPHIGPDGTE